MKNETKTATVVLDNHFNLEGQWAVGSRILQVGEYRVRLSIRTDSHPDQAHAYAEVWSAADLRWNRIYDVHHKEMKSPRDLGYSRDVVAAKREMEPDFTQVLAGAMLVLGVR